MYDLKDKRWVKNVGQLRATDHEVVLTFDDGPGRQLEAILDVLQAKNVPAAFFWQTRLLYNERPWKRVIQEGHQLGSHTHSHKKLSRLPKAGQRKQIKDSVDKMRAVTNTNVSLFRPPFGQYDESTMEILEELNITPVMWEISSYDWIHRKDPETIISNVAAHVRDGSIILLHELEQTQAVLPRLIDEIRNKGYQFTLL
ncbi:polysaccharide deacetylase family protein [Salibacterium aidingense]|uniref:polysaccharide deacetylase family protein n=1 Tax=Salibacterium aidingense TaxID=384933 RepID=UPI0004091503|nr:polysaccharide deacetylase family protein [Salibacterium aidingense]